MVTGVEVMVLMGLLDVVVVEVEVITEEAKIGETIPDAKDIPVEDGNTLLLVKEVIISFEVLSLPINSSTKYNY